MSDELIALQDIATQARAKADELKAALTDGSSDEDKAAAAQADTDATTAESTFAEAKAKADADAEAAAKAEAEAAAAAAAAQGGDDKKDETSADASRTGYAEKGLRVGDACDCPDGRKGTVHQYDAGLICMPNQDQG